MEYTGKAPDVVTLARYRYSSPEGFKPGKVQRFQSSPERAIAFRSVASPEHTPTKAPSLSGRESDAPIKPPSPETKSVHSGSQSDEGSDQRSRVPLSRVNFGVAAQRSRKDFDRGFGEAAKWSQRHSVRGGLPSSDATAR